MRGAGKSPCRPGPRNRTRWTATSCTSPSKPAFWRIRGSTRSRRRTRRCSNFRVARGCAGQAGIRHARFRERQCVAVNGKKLNPLGRHADPEQARRQTWRRPRRHGGEPLCRHEIRGVYETPGGAILHFAHRQMETLTMDREVMHLRDSLIPRYAELVYYGYWFSPERLALQALVTESQKNVTGTVRVKLYKGNIMVRRPQVPRQPLQPAHRHDGSRPDQSLQPGRRHRLHPAECLAAESCGAGARQTSKQEQEQVEGQVKAAGYPGRRFQSISGFARPLAAAINSGRMRL